MGDPELGKKIRAIRKRLGLTQSAFAELVGVGQSQTISNWERGVQEPKRKHLRRIADVSGTPLAELIDVMAAPAPSETAALRDEVETLRGELLEAVRGLREELLARVPEPARSATPRSRRG